MKILQAILLVLFILIAIIILIAMFALTTIIIDQWKHINYSWTRDCAESIFLNSLVTLAAAGLWYKIINKIIIEIDGL